MPWSQRSVTPAMPCPKCGAAVDTGAGFGMVSCPSCNEVFILGSSAEENDILPSPPVSFEVVGAAAEHEMLVPSDAETVLDIPLEVPELLSEPVNFNDVAEFGNRSEPVPSSGGLVYDVVICGIDTPELRDEVSHCFNDKRLKIQSDEALAKIKKGELRLEELNPVKASVILNRLKHLPFKISWNSRQLIKGILVASLFTFSVTARASEWARHEINLKGYYIKIRDQQEELRALIDKKNKNKDPQVRDELLQQLTKKDEELKKTYKEFQTEREHVRFEHPEQGEKLERRYRHVKMKSLEELEDESGLDGQLGKLKRKVIEQYP